MRNQFPFFLLRNNNATFAQFAKVNFRINLQLHATYYNIWLVVVSRYAVTSSREQSSMVPVLRYRLGCRDFRCLRSPIVLYLVLVVQTYMYQLGPSEIVPARYFTTVISPSTLLHP